MQMARFVQVLVLILVLIVAGCAVGCGGAPAPGVENKEAEKARAESTRNFHQQLKEAAKANLQGQRKGLNRGNPGR